MADKKINSMWVLLGATAGMCCSPAVLLAADDERVVQEVVVVGIKGSLERSLDIKRESKGFVDAISAEDVGKLPDANIAEALQRIPGVAIQRSRGEGDFVSIRGLGPDFVRGTINGRTVVSGTETFDSTLSGGSASSTGRATNFDILPSEVINTLEVVKSPSAKHVEGGIGGIVNIKTARPIEYGNKLAFSAEATYREFNKDTDPRASGLFSWVNDEETFGILGSIAYSERNIREDFDRGFGLLSFAPNDDPMTPIVEPSFDTDLDGVGDLGSAFVPLTNNIETFDEERERITFTTTVEWLPDDSSRVVFDALYSQRDITHDEQQAIIVTLPTAAMANPDGSVPVPGSTINGNVINPIATNIGPELVSDEQEAEEDFLSLGFNYSRDFDNWKFSTDVAYAEANGKLDFDRVVIVGDGTADAGNYLFSAGFDGNGFNIVNASTASLSNPGNYFVRNGRVTRTENDDEEFSFQFDVTHELESSIFSSVELGLRYRTREKDVSRADFDGSLGNVRFSDQFSFSSGQGNLLDGGIGPINFRDFIFADVGSTLAAVGNPQPVADPLGTYNTEEDTLAGYIQLNVESEILGIPVVGDVGLRIIETDQDISGQFAGFVIVPNPVPAGIDTLALNGQIDNINFDDSYTNYLPSVNLRFELADDVYLRFAASKSLTRATFEDLSPQIDINPNATADLNGDGIAANATLGNPELEPSESINYDLGVEWYFAEGSALYAGLFYKDIDDFVAVTTNTSVAISGVVFDSVSQPDNQGEAEITGLELGYQHTFASGFGYSLNATFTDTEAEFTSTGEEFDFPGVSDTSYNGTVFYDNGQFEARLVYSWRSEFLERASDVFENEIHNQEFGQLDASVSYRLTDNLAVVLTAVNLTDENADATTRRAGAFGSQFLSESHVGTRYSLGIRGTF